MTRLWLDITRLLERAVIGSLTGIDRAELAYAEHLPRDRVGFVVLNPFPGRLAILPAGAARRFISRLRRAWRDGDAAACRLEALALLGLAFGRPGPVGGTYLLVSHRHLDRPGALGRSLRLAGVRFVPMIHDLIPMTHPEYVRPAETPRHRRRISAVAALADAVLVNSAATADVLQPFLPAGLPVGAVPLGTDFSCKAEVGGLSGIARRHEGVINEASFTTENHGVSQRFFVRSGDVGSDHARSGSVVLRVLRGEVLPGSARAGRAGHPAFVPPAGNAPYFVVIGTIEPRKNHLLLLHIWRRMVEQLGSKAPILMIAGRRGWENENILDLLDRCPALARHVIECSALSDDSLAELIGGARALLMPSFAEGFGLPVAEALALGTPVLCSDIPALRETGGAVPDYIDPLDAPAWQAAIMDYADPASIWRGAQLRRMPGWRPIRWADHVAAAVAFLDQSNGSPT